MIKRSSHQLDLGRSAASTGVLLCLLVWSLILPTLPGHVNANSSRLGAPAAEPAQVVPSIVYNIETNTIEIKRPGAVVRLTDIDNALRDKALLERLGPFEWLLKVHLKSYEQVRLEFHGQSAGGDVNWLKLKSDDEGYASIESSNGQISIRNTRITSWDTKQNGFDTKFEDGSGRAFVAAKNRTSKFIDNRMDVVNSEISHMGFFEETAYGISWKVVSEPESGNPGILGRGITGTIIGSKFHHNYFGVYVWGVGDMVVRNNEFYENFRYGFDAHTMTQRTIVEDNNSHDNGLHGIIFAERCTDNVIRRNIVTNNTGHGIMLHELSNNNIIEDNTVVGNDDGVPLFESSNNIIRRNIISDNMTGIRVYGRVNLSQSNLFEENQISGSQTYGVFIYDAATNNRFQNNRIVSSDDVGVYLRKVSDNILTGNSVRDNEFGVRFDSAETDTHSSGNQIRDNTITDNRQYGIFSYAAPGTNIVEPNQFSGNGLGDVNYPGVSVGALPSDGGGGLSTWELSKLILLGAIVLAGAVTALLAVRRSRRGASG